MKFDNAKDLVAYWVAKNPNMTAHLLAKKISLNFHNDLSREDRYYEAAMSLKAQIISN